MPLSAYSAFQKTNPPTLSFPVNLPLCDVPEDLWSQTGICRREEKAGLLWEWSAYVTGMLVADWRSLFYILLLVCYGP